MIKADGFNSAIIGIDNENKRIVYDKNKMIEILIQDGMDYKEALEHLEHNVWACYVGEHTPIYVYPMNIDEIETRFSSF